MSYSCLQASATPLFQAATFHPGSYYSLQCSDISSTPATKAKPGKSKHNVLWPTELCIHTLNIIFLSLSDVHVHINYHWSSISSERLWASHTVSQGSQPAQTRQVGHQSAHCLPTAGDEYHHHFPHPRVTITTITVTSNIMFTNFFSLTRCSHIMVSMTTVLSGWGWKGYSW